MNKDTERFFKSRIEKREKIKILDKSLVESDLEKIVIEIEEKTKYKEYLPVYSLEAVATSFGKEEFVEKLGWMQVKASIKINENMFVVKVVGKSMESTIPDNSWCVFRKERGGSREGKIVLANCNALRDPESQGTYTIKRYHSEKEYFEDGTWQHKKIILSPDNKNFDDIVLENVWANDFQIVGEFVCVL